MRNIRLAERVAELAAEGERGRIAREIHDGIAQMVFMLTLSLETAIDRVGGDPRTAAPPARPHGAGEERAVGGAAVHLRPAAAAGGRRGARRRRPGQVKEFQAVSNLPVELAVSGEPLPLPIATSAALYRIVQRGWAISSATRTRRTSRSRWHSRATR